MKAQSEVGFWLEFRMVSLEALYKLTERGKLNSVALLPSRIVSSSVPMTKVAVSHSAGDDIRFDNHVQSLSFFRRHERDILRA